MVRTRNVSPSVLFIDDDPDQRTVLGMVLECGGCEVTFCSSAEQALNELENHKFDVVVCDLRMPAMSGEEFLEEFRSVFGTKTPVVLLSAGEDRLDEIYYELGNTRFCKKEHCVKHLVKLVSSVAPEHVL
ncbi:MAG: response regulator [Bdellovibrionota bacterium]